MNLVVLLSTIIFKLLIEQRNNAIMFKFILILFILNISVVLKAQKIKEDHVPLSIITEFKSNYSTATHVIWSCDEDSIYIVQFTLNKSLYLSRYEKEGYWIETNQELPLRLIPDNIREVIDKKFSGFKIISSKTIEKPNKDKIFEFIFKKNKEVYIVMLSKEGQILSKIADHN
jgi:hypothetical protein